LKQIQRAIKRWAKDKQNEGVLEQTNNQALVIRPTHEQKHIRKCPKEHMLEGK